MNWNGAGTGMIWLSVGAVARCFEHGSEGLDSLKCGVFFG